MKLCFVGKFPPIQGGVARDSFWAAVALAHQGIEVHVVTNAREVEPEFRIFDHPWNQAGPPDPRGLVGDRLRVHDTDPASGNGYVPWANPFVTKLAALATDVVEQHGVDLLHSYYFEPYALAAHLAAAWTGVPFGVRHAGSDLGRLMRDPALHTAYARTVLAADYVVAAASTAGRFLALGVDLTRLYRLPRASLPEQYFHPNAPALDVNALLVALRAAYPADFYDGAYHRTWERRFDPTRPTVGIYGKVGETKGSYDLLRALGRLHRDGLDFNLLALTQGDATRMRRFFHAIDAEGLTARAWVLPFLPHWQVPSFIRACTAVCFLERAFPITIHRPVVPREVIACGTALILSREIAARQPYRDALRDGENALLVEPRDTEALAAALRRCLADPAYSHAMGARAYDELRGHEDRFDAYASRLAEVFHAIARDVVSANAPAGLGASPGPSVETTPLRSGAASPSRGASPTGVPAPLPKAAVAAAPSRSRPARAALAARRTALVREHYPRLHALDAAAIERHVGGWASGAPADATPTLDYLLALGAYLARVLAADPALPPYAADLARYERALLAARYCSHAEDVLAADGAVLAATAGSVGPAACPRPAAGVQAEMFGYDVVALAEALDADKPPAGASAEGPPPTMSPGEWHLAFVPGAGAEGPQVLRLHPLARAVLALCDGQRTSAQIAALLEQPDGPDPAPIVQRAVQRLTAVGVLQCKPRSS